MPDNRLASREDESQSDRFQRKTRDAPLMVIGLGGLVAVCGIGVYRFRNRGTMPVSQFLMQLRIAAQATVVAALMAGALYSMFDENSHE